MANFKKGNRFARGSGVYKCGCCGRATRSTGRGDNEYSRLCVECFDLAGFENQLSDNGIESFGDYERQAVQQLYDAIKSKGGDASGFDDLVAAVQKLAA